MVYIFEAKSPNGLHYKYKQNIICLLYTSLDYHRYYRTWASEDATLMKQKNLFLKYHTKLKYETLDKRYFPTKGLKTNISYTIYTDLRCVQETAQPICNAPVGLGAKRTLTFLSDIVVLDVYKRQHIPSSLEVIKKKAYQI